MSAKHAEISFLLIVFIGYRVVSLHTAETIWRLQFTADAVVLDHFQSLTAMSAPHCGHWCVSNAGCQAFGFSSGSKTCWLYDHLVEYYNLSAIAEPETRYFWLLTPHCPTALGYNLTGSVCFRMDWNQRTWDEAREMCHSYGGILFVGNPAENLDLLKPLTRERIFLGASDADSEGDWFWLDGTVLPTNTSLWEPGQPDDWQKREDAVTLTKSFLNDYRHQNDTAYAACQIILVED